MGRIDDTSVAAAAAAAAAGGGRGALGEEGWGAGGGASLTAPAKRAKRARGRPRKNALTSSSSPRSVVGFNGLSVVGLDALPPKVVTPRDKADRSDISLGKWVSKDKARQGQGQAGGREEGPVRRTRAEAYEMEQSFNFLKTKKGAPNAGQTSSNFEYFNALKHDCHRLLVKEEEFLLGGYIQQFMWSEQRRNNMTVAMGREPTHEELATDLSLEPGALASEIRKGKNARELLVASNLRLVVSIARRYRFHGAALEDLIQDGTMGLIRAAEKYDPTRGFRFSTYATWWIRQRVQMSVKKQRLVKLPIRMQDQSEKIRRTGLLVCNVTGEYISMEEVAERLNITTARVQEVKLKMRPHFSLDFPNRSGGMQKVADNAADGSQSTVGDNLSSRSALADVGIDYSLLRSQLECCMHVELSQLERDIVRMRIGLDDGRAKTAKELADVFQMPARVILREEKAAISKLRESHATFGLKRDYFQKIGMPQQEWPTFAGLRPEKAA